MNSKIIIPITVVISVIITVGVMYAVGIDQPPPQVSSTNSEPKIIYVEKPESKYFEGTHNIKRISSQEELENILESISSLDAYSDNFAGFPRMVSMETSMEMPEMLARDGDVSPDFVPAPAVPSMLGSEEAKSITQSGGSNYSATNVQVENVDEPDYIKNDGKYVYLVSRNTLSIIDAYPAESASLILKIALDIESQYIENMFLNKDRLVIFYNGQSDDEIIPQYEFIPHRSYSPVTHALVVDVSEKEKPVILKDYSIAGHFRDARMIGDFVYFVTNNNIDYQHPRLPVILEDSMPVLTPEAFYFDNIEQLSNFNTLTAIDVFGDAINSETFLMGYTGTFYVSENNFYLAYQQNMPFGFYESSSRDRFYEVIVPLLPLEVQDEIKKIQNDSSMNLSSQWNEISDLMQKSYNAMNKEERERLFDRIREALNEYDARIQEDLRKTIIHKISIDEDKIEYIAKGEVPGRLLNQFSMDENGDRFRVATTTEYYTQFEGWVRANAVYVLDEQLHIIGNLEDIAPNESIFSARFMGDRLYLVTFQQIDPFFVIDLSSDTPKILGELKIPGFSNYLHPFDDEHVIGIGRDTKEIGKDRVQQLGIKIALFNVKDVGNPKVLDDIVIGDSSTHSDVLHDHKAFFFDQSRGVLSIPITGDSQVLSDTVSTSKMFVPEFNRWSGFFVYNLDESKGFELKGTVVHSDDNRYYGMNKARTFYIDNVLYTISDKYMKMNSFDELDEINSIKLQNTGQFIDYIYEEEPTR